MISKRSVQTSNALVQGGGCSESPLAAARQGERAARDEEDKSGGHRGPAARAPRPRRAPHRGRARAARARNGRQTRDTAERGQRTERRASGGVSEQEGSLHQEADDAMDATAFGACTRSRIARATDGATDRCTSRGRREGAARRETLTRPPAVPAARACRRQPRPAAARVHHRRPSQLALSAARALRRPSAAAVAAPVQSRPQTTRLAERAAMAVAAVNNIHAAGSACGESRSCWTSPMWTRTAR